LLVYVSERRLTGTLVFSDATGELAHLVLELGSITKVYVRDVSGAFVRGTAAPDHETVEALLRPVFALPEAASFAFFDGFDTLRERAPLAPPLDPVGLVTTAIGLAPPLAHIEATLSKVETRRIVLGARSDFARLRLDPVVAGALEPLRGQPTTHAALASDLSIAGGLDRDAARLLVYALLITKQVELVDRVSVPPGGGSYSGPFPRPSGESLRPGALPSAPSGVMLASAPALPRSSAPSISGIGLARPSTPSVAPPPSGPVGVRAPIASVPPDPASAAMRAAVTSPGPIPAATPVRAPSPSITDASPEDVLQARRLEIEERARGIDREDYFAMLGVARDATPEEVQAAYFALARKWHPDRLPSSLSGVREACARVFARISEAHSTLTDPARRRNYMTLLAEGGATPEAQASILSVVEAATNFQKAEICLKRSDAAQAEELCRKAHLADPKQADYLALLAWLEAIKPEHQGPAATLQRIQMLERAIAMNERCEKAYFYRGLLYKRLQQMPQAVRDFRRAVELNPRNIDAAREVRLHEMRVRKGTSVPPPAPDKNGSTPPGRRTSQRPGSSPDAAAKAGLFGRLFKK
jgi:tetratricopeptide (TPR) repeat protein